MCQPKTGKPRSHGMCRRDSIEDGCGFLSLWPNVNLTVLLGTAYRYYIFPSLSFRTSHDLDSPAIRWDLRGTDPNAQLCLTARTAAFRCSQDGSGRD